MKVDNGDPISVVIGVYLSSVKSPLLLLRQTRLIIGSGSPRVLMDKITSVLWCHQVVIFTKVRIYMDNVISTRLLR